MLRSFATRLRVPALGFLAAFLVLGTAPAHAVGSSSNESGGSSYGSNSSSSSASAETEDAAALFAEALDYNKEGWFRLAISNLRTVTQMEPRNADAWNELGFAYRNVENYRQSARAYDRALSIDPKHLGALNYQGFMFLETDQIEAAENNLSTLKSLCGSCDAYNSLRDALNAR